MRLTDSSEFEKVYKQGKAFRGRFFSVHAFLNEIGASRLGLSVSRKVGNAVARNTFRRRMREIFAAEVGAVDSHLDLVISARPAARDAGFDELRDEFRRALRRLGVVSGENTQEG